MSVKFISNLNISKTVIDCVFLVIQIDSSLKTEQNSVTKLTLVHLTKSQKNCERELVEKISIRATSSLIVKKIHLTTLNFMYLIVLEK